MNPVDLDRQLASLTRAVRSISHGDSNGPTGLEMLSMAVRDAGADIASALRDVAEALNNTADKEN